VDTGAGPSVPITDRVQFGMVSPTAMVMVSLHYFD
jgi:hypothetical protein